MLTSLCIDNFTIVSHLELDFSSGMTAFTGETGAGKSIMIDALMLALGERADPSVIRQGADKCEVSACFHVEEASPPALFLKELGITLNDDDLVLRRIVLAEGRSKSYINGQPFPLQKIKELSEMLVDIHGQHQHQTLLHHATHRAQLDQYAKHSTLLDELSILHHQCIESHNQLSLLKQQEDSALLQTQCDELDALNLQAGEMQRLHEEHQMLHHALAYLTQSQHILDALTSEESPGLIKGLNQLLQRLTTLPKEQPHIKNTEELLQNALIQCEEARDEMSQFSAKIPLDAEALSRLEERLSLIHQTARKYHVDASQLPNHAKVLHEQLLNLQKASKAHHALQEIYKQQLKDYDSKALTLRASRLKQGQALAKALTGIIQNLGMPKGHIELSITPLEKRHAHGIDKVEYIVCTNPGMPPDGLGKIVSGGELSRIGLAIHVTTAVRGTTPTLLFDEVDVGIGGATAALVGQLLQKLGERLQVFCVTHQPQVAAFANHHFLVQKQSNHEQTFSRVLKLEHPEKVNEIARMLGGLTITEQTLSHACELLEQSQ